MVARAIAGIPSLAVSIAVGTAMPGGWLMGD